MKGFEFPANIKQVGTIESGLKIYMEDYVSSYLIQYATAGGYDERLAVLVGRYMQIDSVPVVFISGAILGKHTHEENGILKFTRQSMEYVDEQIETHFPGMEIMGWMQSQPGYGTFLNPQYKSYHKQFFGKNHQTLFVIDPLEKVNTFYINKNGGVHESNGYFIYYEKNQHMHEYMLENKVAKPTKGFRPSLVDNNYEQHQLDEAAATQTQEKSPFLQLFRSEKDMHSSASRASSNTINFQERVKGRSANKEREQEREAAAISTPDTNYDQLEYTSLAEEKAPYELPNLKQFKPKKADNIASFEATKTKKQGRNNRRAASMLLSMSSVMLVISFVMAGALLRSQDRLSLLEEQLQTMTVAHMNIMQSLQATQEVVAMNLTLTAGGVETVDGVQLSGQTDPTVPVQASPAEQIQSAPQAPAPSTTAQRLTDPWPSIANLPHTYVVQPGDNLLAISQMFYGTTAMVEQIMYVNNIDNQDMIFSGMILLLPNSYPNN